MKTSAALQRTLQVLIITELSVFAAAHVVAQEHG